MANPDKACKAERACAHAPRRTFWVGVTWALVGAGLWGVSGACAQYLFSHYGITPMLATAVRSLVASLIFFGVLFFRRRYLLQLMWGSEARTKLAFLAFGAALFADQFAYCMTIAHTNAGTATVLQMLGTVFVMLFTCVLGRHLPKASEFAGLVCAFAATVLIATQGDLRTLVLPAAGLFWGLLNALSVALYVMIPRNCGLFDRFGSFAATGVGMLVTCVCSGVAYAVQLAGGAGAPRGRGGHGRVRLVGASWRADGTWHVRVVRAVPAWRCRRGLGEGQLAWRHRAGQRQRMRLGVFGHGVFRLRLGGPCVDAGHVGAGHSWRQAEAADSSTSAITSS